MATYLTSDIIKEAVNRLGTSSVRSRLGDYLILKRAIVRQGMGDRVELSQLNDDWVESIKDLAAIEAGPEWDRPNFFNPFGAARDRRTRGYRSDKYTSNGSSNTVMDWHGKAHSPVSRVPPMKPAHVQIDPDIDPERLTRWFILDRDGVNRPTLRDSAIWWFRHTDLDTFDWMGTVAGLEAAFRHEVGLTLLEEEVLLDTDWDTRDEEPRVSDRAARPALYLPEAPTRTSRHEPGFGATAGVAPTPIADLNEAVAELVLTIESRGFAFQPWQIAAFVTAIRTKPLVLLAGISGTGKTALPRLVAEATGALSQTIAVRPDWTDSSDLLGRYTLNERFVPGALLRACKNATDSPDREQFFVLDEMNIARVEYYMAEVLSRIEERESSPNGPVTREALITGDLPDDWQDIHMTGNLALVGSVNMDESTHDFSRKVMDRSFIIEFSDVDLNSLPAVSDTQAASREWPVTWWQQQHLRLADLNHELHADTILRTIGALSAVNEHLARAQLQVGYRVRDEIVMFCVNAEECIDSFVDHAGAIVDPLDLAISLKVLPRILGGELTIRSVLEGLLHWANGTSDDENDSTDDAARDDSAEIDDNGARFPVCAKRITMMLDRMAETGYASYWT